LPIFQLTAPKRAEMVRPASRFSRSTSRWPDWPSQDGKSVIGGGLLLRSLLELSRSPARGINMMPVEAAGDV